MDSQQAAPELVEVRPEITVADAEKLDIVCAVMQEVLTRKNAAKLLIHYGAEHIDAVLAWYGAEAAARIKNLPTPK